MEGDKLDLQSINRGNIWLYNWIPFFDNLSLHELSIDCT